MLVVVAVDDGQEATARDELRERGAETVARWDAGPGRGVLQARFATGQRVEPVVAALRAAGWPATERPEGGGHLSAWLANNAPTVISERLCVCFPWSEFDRAGVGGVVEVDPGRSFGTGSHPSTRLLLTELDRRICAGDRVLDVGCGSGVLALGAARLGALVVATDVEPAACTATCANARRNGLSGRVSVDGRPVAALPGVFEAVVANIGSEALAVLAPAIAARAAPGGWLGLSGLSPAQVSVVAAAYRRLGWSVEAVRRDVDWAALVLSRPA